jgi:hypothetical protein
LDCILKAITRVLPQIHDVKKLGQRCFGTGRGMRANTQDGTRGFADNLFCHGSHEELLEVRFSARPHSDEINVL